MEVGGKLPDEAGAPFCKPCADAGNSVTAVKFCAVCKEWLCVYCTEYHRRLKATRTHTLLDKDLVADVTQEENQENRFHYCGLHPTELIKYYCPEHGTLHCGDCAASSSCKMDKLSSNSCEIRNKDEFKEMQSNIGQLMKSTNSLESKVNTMIESVVEQGACHLNQVAKHEQLLIKKIKAHSASLTDDINIATSEAKYQLGNVLDMCTDILSTSEQLYNGLDESNANDSESFIAFVKAKPMLESKADELNVAGRQTQIKQYSFKKCVDLETMLQTSKSFGTYKADVDDVHTSGRPDVPSSNVPQHLNDTGCYHI